jgi:hypothetical protein
VANKTPPETVQLLAALRRLDRLSGDPRATRRRIRQAESRYAL